MKIFHVIKDSDGMLFNIEELDGHWHENGLVQINRDTWINVSDTDFYHWVLVDAVAQMELLNEIRLNNLHDKIQFRSRWFNQILKKV